MIRLLCITDLHGEAVQLANIGRAAGDCHAVLFGGDITNFGSPEEAAELVETARQFAPDVWAVAGNCDSAAIDATLDRLGVGLHGRGVEKGGLGLYGLSGAPPWRSHMYEFSEDELAAALDAGRAALNGDPLPHVVLAHVPPYGCRCDRTLLLQHIGSHAVRRHIETHYPTLLVCGHVHEARGTDRLGTTTIVNCGPARKGCYAVVELDPLDPAAPPQVRLEKA